MNFCNKDEINRLIVANVNGNHLELQIANRAGLSALSIA
jgi:hypothetical protein